MVRAGVFEPRRILSRIEPLTDAIHAYKSLDERQPGWVKIELIPTA
jgi:threonine dehydrogenase-like Zn-dependent dehydrogenase